MLNREEPHERLIRLEEKHDNMYHLTQQIADNADCTAKALQELVLIHKETSVKADADRQAIRENRDSLAKLWENYNQLSKSVWRYVFIGTGMVIVFSTIWSVGLLPAFIEANGSL